MNLLALVQALHREAKQPGSAPSAVTGQTGRKADLVRWAIEAWNDIQRDAGGQWKWMRSAWTVNTVADTPSYAYGAVTDVAASAVITRFRRWELDDENPPFIYLVSDGVATERELPLAPWPEFRRLYLRASHTGAPPSWMSVDPADLLYLGPTPDDIYTLSGNYWKSNQVLSADSDIPEMPVDFHMLIVYRAMLKYGYNSISQEILARARTEGQPIYDALLQNQGYANFRLRLPGPLA